MSADTHKILQHYDWASSVDRDLRSSLYALLLSMLIHILAIIVWQNFEFSVPKFDDKKIEVRIINEPKPPRIVPESQALEQEPTEPTLNRASKSTATKIETHRKGDTPAIAPPQQVDKIPTRTKPQPQPKTKVQEKQAAKVEQAKVDPILSLGSSDLLRSLNGIVKQGKQSNSDSENSLRPEVDYTPFRRSLSPAVSGRIGSPDYLPTIQDGEINLLNAKADRYAVFVRRVALQVFGILRRMSWSSLTGHQISKLQQFSEVRAIISPDGKLLKVEFGGSSGVAEFDSLLNEAVKLGAWDKNPPKGAQMPDGNIHFVFRARSWSRLSPSGIGEQRWLLLSSGLL